MSDEKATSKVAREDLPYQLNLFSSTKEETKEQKLKRLAQHFKDAIDYDDQFEHQCLQDALRDEDYGYAASICIKLDAAKEGSLLANQILEEDKKDEA